MTSGFLVLSFNYYHFCPPRVALSDDTGKSDIRILWVKWYVGIKCNKIENTLFHSEQIGAAGAKSPQTSSYEKHHSKQN